VKKKSGERKVNLRRQREKNEAMYNFP